jgi:hypothetical protein
MHTMSNAKTTVEKMRERQQQVQVGTSAASAPAKPTTPPAPTGASPQTKPANQGGQKQTPKSKQRRYMEFRLPDGSEYHASYDATMLRWTVTLTVPGLLPYEATGGGLHPMVILLGRRWFEEHGFAAQGGNKAPAAV